MLKRIWLPVIFALLISSQLFAAENILIPQVTMETEGEINGKTQYSISHYGSTRVDLGFGGTTDHRLTAGLTFSGQIFEKPFMFTIDPKWGKNYEVFQKFAVSDLLVFRGNISVGLRQEMLVAGPANDMLFFRVGPELVLKDLLKFDRMTISPAVSPFYDFQNKSAGVFLTLRWNF